MSNNTIKKRAFEDAFDKPTTTTTSNNNNKVLLSFYQQQEIDNIKIELEHERSIRLIENRKFQQIIDRLERKVTLAVEETIQTKELYEYQKEESDKLILQLKEARTIAFQRIRELEIEIDEYHHQQHQKNDNDDDDKSSNSSSSSSSHHDSDNNDNDNRSRRHHHDRNKVNKEKKEEESSSSKVHHWKKKCQQLQEQLQLQMKNEDLLKEQIQSIKTEFYKMKNNQQQQQQITKTTTQSTTVVNEEETLLLKKEINLLRVQNIDQERNIRQQQRKYNDLLTSYKKNITELENYKMKSNRCTTLQQNVNVLQMENEQIKANIQPWIEFHNTIQKIITNKKKNKKDTTPIKIALSSSSSSSSLLLASPPPDMNVIIQELENLEQQQLTDQKVCQQYQEKCQLLQQQIDSIQNDNTIIKTSKLELLAEQRKLKNQIIELQTLNEHIQHQIQLYQRENDSLRTLLSTFETTTKTGSSTIPLQKYQTIQVSLNTAKDEIKTLQTESSKLQQQLNQLLMDKAKLENEVDTINQTNQSIKEKYTKLRDALQQEKENVQQAQQRVVTAEQLAGKGSYNPITTKVFHLSETPLIQSYKEEIQILQRQLQHYQQHPNINTTTSASTTTPVDGGVNIMAPSSSTSTPLPPRASTSGSGGSSSHTIGPSSAINMDKLNQRLKENFKEQIGLFREGVYLMTGYKVDMITSGTDRPTFRIRSMFAEQEEDHLLFQWPTKKVVTTNNKKGDHGDNDSNNKNNNDNDDDDDTTSNSDVPVTSLDLLNTPLAKLLSTTPSYQYMTNYQSLPAFLASVQLNLFEQQTHICK